MSTGEKLARQAIRLENTLYLRWLECQNNHAAPEYILRLSVIRRKAVARVFRRQVD